MQTRSTIRLATVPVVLVLIGLTATCDDPPVRVPTAPTTPSIVALTIEGPDTLAPGASAPYRAIVRLSDGTQKIATVESGVVWSTSSANLRVDATGLVTAMVAGEAALTARISPRSATRSILSVPDGTYRVTGVVREAEAPHLPITGARVEALPGPAAVTTGANGTYRLYGVPPGATLHVTAEGYRAAGRNLQLTSHAVEDMALELEGPRLGLGGNYTITIDMDGPCSTLASDLRHRVYEAVITRNGVQFQAQLTSPAFRLEGTAGSTFDGFVSAGRATFTMHALNTYYYYYYYYFGWFGYPSVAEQLEDGSVLVVSGQGTVTGTEQDLVGTLEGRIDRWDLTGTSPRFLAACGNSPMRVAFKRK